MNNNTVAVFAVALMGLQNVIVVLREGRIASLSIFSGWADEDIWEFIRHLEIAFLTNQIANNKKFYIEISCLTSIAANWYEINQTTVVNWNMVRQPDNMKLKESLITRFDIVTQ